MKASQFLVSTLRQAPAEAEVISHQLMLRAGMIRRVAAGIYTYMPMGLRVMHKIEAIIREEMNRAGAMECSMPVVQPGQLWSETGRLESMGDELLRLQDRHGRDFVLQPTSEEVVTDIARQEFRSWKQLPKNLYQIQTKFRDERRPRFGLMRGREFIMKDAYSFDVDAQAAERSYQIMAKAYRAIFDRFGLIYRAVSADSGAIGGSLSEEFQVIASTGEDAIVFSTGSDYAANMEKAESLPPQHERAQARQKLQKTPTPGRVTCEQVAALLDIPLSQTVKSIALIPLTPKADDSDDAGPLVLLLLRGDHDMNEVKVSKLTCFESGFRFATEQEILDCFGCKPGYLGPLQTRKPLRLIADREVAVMTDWICGANEEGFHYTGVNWGRDLPEPEWVADLRNVVAGDPSPDGQGELAIERGIEVGHIFYLGTKYSLAMQARFLAEDGVEKPFEMGCYGIGVSRLPAAAIEQNHDERGIIWPDAIAPFEVVICPLGMDRNDEVRQVAHQLHQEFERAGVDVILDDRGERAGVMFADWELIGVPHRITIGAKNLRNGMLEYQNRREGETHILAVDDMVDFVQNRLRKNKRLDGQ